MSIWIGVDQSISSSFQAHVYEAVNDIYHVLTPIYEANRDFKKLSQVHSKLHEYFNRILIQVGSEATRASCLSTKHQSRLFSQGQ